MAGIFGGHIFQGQGLGQATADMTFTLEEADAAAAPSASAPSKTGAAYLPPAPTSSGKPSAAPAYLPGAPVPSAMVPGASGDNTALYVVGGVAVVGLLAIMMMSGRRGTVSANKRGRRARRSRARRR